MRTILLLCTFLFTLSTFGQSTSVDNSKLLVLSEDVNLMEEPSLNSRVITLIRNGNTIKVLEEVKEFSRIEFLKKEGYVLTSKIRDTSNHSKTSTTNTLNPNRQATSNNKQSTSSSSSAVNRSKKTSRSSSYSSLCGARTKKGGSCQRRVSGGGRCWQH